MKKQRPNDFFLGGANAALLIMLVFLYVALGTMQGVREYLTELTGEIGAWLFPITTVLSLKIAINFTSRPKIIAVLVAGLAIQSALAGIFAIWTVRSIVMFNPPTYPVTLDFYLKLDDVRHAGGYLGQQVADLTIELLINLFPSITSIEGVEAFIWGIALLIAFVLGSLYVGFLFLNPTSVHVMSKNGKGKGKKKVVNIVN